jgi:hypothetical protein
LARTAYLALTLAQAVVEVDQLPTAMLAMAALVAELVQEVAQQVMAAQAYQVKVTLVVVALDFLQLVVVQVAAVKAALV